MSHPRIAALVLAALATGCSGEIGARAPIPGDAPGDRPPDPGREFECEGAPVPGPNLVRRLTLGEYVATVEGALGVAIDDVAATELPPEPPSDGFSNTAATLSVSLAHVEAYERLAGAIVDRLDLDAFLERHAPCRDEGCEDDFIDSAGRLLFRHPVRAEEREALAPIFAAARSEGGDFAEGARLTLQAMLQSPRFLYRAEDELGDGSTRRLDGHEMASRLSYLVWGAPPDEALFAAADAGELRTDAQIAEQVRRMLDDERAARALRTFASEWLGLARLDHLTRDAERFPEWSTELGAAMKEETLAFVERILLEEERPLRDLFDAQLTIVSPELAEHYGLPSGGLVDLSEVPERGGLLTQGAIHTVGGNESSMVMRGLFLLDRVLCLDIGSPPPGVDTTPPPLEPGRSQRFYSEQRVADPACGGCHGRMEPIAFGLERFDAVGVHHLTDEHGNALLENGSVRLGPGASPVPYADVGELMSLLAEAERVRDCLSLKANRFAMGRSHLATDGCSLAAMRDRFIASEGTYADLLTAIATSPMFTSLKTEAP